MMDHRLPCWLSIVLYPSSLVPRLSHTVNGLLMKRSIQLEKVDDRAVVVVRQIERRIPRSVLDWWRLCCVEPQRRQA